MAKTDDTKVLIYRIVSITLVIASIVFSAVFFVNIRNGRYPDTYVEISGPFDATARGIEYSGVDLKDVVLGEFRKGDHFEYSFILSDTPLKNPVMSLYVDHAAIKVYFDDVLAYTNGDTSSRMLGYGYINIDLPDDYAGVKVKVTYDCVENEGMVQIPEPVLFDSTARLHNFIIDNAPYFVIDLAILVSCLIIMFIGIIFSGTMLSLSRLVFLGMAFFMMGMWEMCTYNLIWIFSDSLVLKGYIEYSSLYTGPFFLAVYFYYEFFLQESEKTRRIYKYITIAQGLFTFSVFILHFLDIVHLPAMLQIFHLIMIINIFAILVMLVRQMIRHDNSHRSLVVGLTVVVVLTMLDLVRFIFGKYFLKDGGKDFKSYLLIGFFLFLVAMIIDFLINQRRNLYKIARAEAMDKLAHVDIMTNLANRRRCEEEFEELLASDKVFEIISLDLNYLKATNDKYGHQEGDKLLTDFSKILTQACEGRDALPGRMGGDEFIIIVPNAVKEDCSMLLRKLDMLRDKINVNRTPIQLSFAYGGCRSDDEKLKNPEEGETIVEAAYRIADERMYEMKTAMKARREDQGL